jgi:hypothetical protein
MSQGIPNHSFGSYSISDHSVPGIANHLTITNMIFKMGAIAVMITLLKARAVMIA